MKKLLIGFLPWILFSLIIGSTKIQIEIAIIIALISLLTINAHELKKKFILTWGSLISFLILGLMVFVYDNTWFLQHTWLLSNGALAVIAWFSLAINKPFTLQYAKDKVPVERTKHTSFIKVNIHITLVWALAFTISALAHTIKIVPPSLLSNGLVVIAIIFSIKYPEWYRASRLARLKQKTAQSPFLQGNYAPVRDELDIDDLKIIGEIPKELSGAYMRNGPNPAFAPISYTYPFDGDGMIHAVYLKDGKARYRNRFVQTDGYKVEQRAGKAIYGGLQHLFPPDKKYFANNEEPGMIKNGSYINIIKHGDKLISLYESSYAYEVDNELNTLKKWMPDNNEIIEVGPHPRLDPKTNDRWFLLYHAMPPYLQLYCIDTDSHIKKHFTIDTDRANMIHDFVSTENYLIVFQCPVFFDLGGAQSGGNIIQWRPNAGVKIAIISKHDGSTNWVSVSDAFFVFHFVNAYEKNDDIIIDYVSHEKLDFIDDKFSVGNKTALVRSTIALNDLSVSTSIIDSSDVEFPRFNESLNSMPYQYAYAVKNSRKKGYDVLVKYDVDRLEQQNFDFGASKSIGETIYVPKNNPQSEDDGYLMTFVYCSDTDSSDFVILDAKDITKGPIATVKMPRRIPYGLHGNWISL